MKTICICGGGALGHVIGGYLSAKNKAIVNILTSKPSLWNKRILVTLPNKIKLKGHLNIVSDNPKEAIEFADIVLLCLPGFLIKEEIIKIRPFLKKGAFVGSVFSSTGFFFEAKEVLPNDIYLWGFQRVPFIARVGKYGVEGNLLGFKQSYNIAIEGVKAKEKEEFRLCVEHIFDKPVYLLNNYLEASLTNSNPILHTSRLYSLFSTWEPQFRYDHNFLFYEEWTVDAAELAIAMDEELFRLLKVLPVSKDFLPKLIDYYESHDAESLSKKISNIEAFKKLTSPMKKDERGWYPDFTSRYFTEDFPYGLKYIYQLLRQYNISSPNIDKVYNWGLRMINKI